MNKREINLFEKTDLILKKILDKKDGLIIADLIKGKIKPRDLQIVLLKTYEQIVKNFKIDDIVERYESSRFVQPSKLNQRELLKIDQIAYDIISSDFEPIELSPVSPIGTNAVLANIDQKNILSAVRNIEVNADATTVLALECAIRKKRLIKQDFSASAKEINLCTSQRSIRSQSFPENSGFTPHFKIFAACTAAKDTGDEEFESMNIKKHVSFYLDLMRRLNQEGYCSSNIKVLISDIRITEKIIKTLNLNRKKLIRNNQLNEFEPNFKPFSQNKITFPKIVESIKELDEKEIEKYGIKTSVIFLRQIQLKAIDELKTKYPEVSFGIDLHRLDGIGYYENLCLNISASNPVGLTFPLVDGGLTDWIKKILHSGKEALFISGFGTELFCNNFKKNKL